MGSNYGDRLNFPDSELVRNEYESTKDKLDDYELEDWQTESVRRRLQRIGKEQRRIMNAKITNTKKKIVTSITRRTLNKGRKGTIPFDLYENMAIRYDKETNQPNGVRYKGTLVMIRRGGKLVRNPNATVAYPNFIRDVFAASGQPKTTSEGQISAQISEASRELAPSQESIDSVKENLMERLEEAKDEVITPASVPVQLDREPTSLSGTGVVENEVDSDHEEEMEKLKGHLNSLVANKGLSIVKAEKIFFLRNNDVISGQETREIIGSLMIRHDTKSESPEEDKFIKVGYLAKEAERFAKLPSKQK